MEKGKYVVLCKIEINKFAYIYDIFVFFSPWEKEENIFSTQIEII